MKKNWISLFIGFVLFLPSFSFAVGLGAVRTYSHLNERLVAEVPVLSLGKKGKMDVGLAKNKVFLQRGVARSQALNDLTFAFVEKGGRVYVRLGSKKPVSLPYLNFILRLTTAHNSVYREYAIFLDPPSVGEKMGHPIASKPYHLTRNKTNSSKHSKKSRRSKTHAFSRARSGQYGPVRRGETLWSIAAYVRPSKIVSIREMVRQLKRANPRLSRGLPAGIMLKVPVIRGYGPFRGGYAKIPLKRYVKKFKAKKKKLKPVALVTRIHRNERSKSPAIKKEPQDLLSSEDSIVSPNRKTVADTSKEQRQNLSVGPAGNEKPKVSENEKKESALPSHPSENEMPALTTEQPVKKKPSILPTNIKENVALPIEKKTSLDHRQDKGSSADQSVPIVAANHVAERQDDKKNAVVEKDKTKKRTSKEALSNTNIASDNTKNKQQPEKTTPQVKKTLPKTRPAKIEPVQSKESSSLIPILGGVAILLLGGGGLFWARKRRLKKMEDRVVLLDDEDVDELEDESVARDEQEAQPVVLDEAKGDKPSESVDDEEKDFEPHLFSDPPAPTAGIASGYDEKTTKNSEIDDILDVDLDDDFDFSKELSELAGEDDKSKTNNEDKNNDLVAFSLDNDDTHSDFFDEISTPFDGVEDEYLSEAKGIEKNTTDDVAPTYVDELKSEELNDDAGFVSIDLDDEVTSSTEMETKAEKYLLEEGISSVQLKLDLAKSFISVSMEDKAKEALKDILEHNGKGATQEQMDEVNKLLRGLAERDSDSDSDFAI